MYVTRLDAMVKHIHIPSIFSVNGDVIHFQTTYNNERSIFSRKYLRNSSHLSKQQLVDESAFLATDQVTEIWKFDVLYSLISSSTFGIPDVKNSW